MIDLKNIFILICLILTIAYCSTEKARGSVDVIPFLCSVESADSGCLRDDELMCAMHLLEPIDFSTEQCYVDYLDCIEES